MVIAILAKEQCFQEMCYRAAKGKSLTDRKKLLSCYVRHDFHYQHYKSIEKANIFQTGAYTGLHKVHSIPLNLF